MSFLALPTEIRVQTYKYIFAEAEDRVYRYTTDNKGNPTETTQPIMDRPPVSRFGILQASSFVRAEVHSVIRASKPYRFRWLAPRRQIDRYDDRRALLLFFDKVELHLHIEQDKCDRTRIYSKDLTRVRKLIRHMATPKPGASSLTILLSGPPGFNLLKVNPHIYVFVKPGHALHEWSELKIMVSWRTDSVQPLIWPRFDSKSDTMHGPILWTEYRGGRSTYLVRKFTDLMDGIEGALGKPEATMIQDNDTHWGVCAHFRPARSQAESEHAGTSQDHSTLE